MMSSTGRRRKILARILIGIGTERIVTPEQSEGAGLVLFYLWPSVLAISSMFGITALLVSQKWGDGSLVFASFLAWIGVEGGLYLIAGTVPGGSGLPIKGPAAGLVVALFFCVVLGASYWAWHSTLNGCAAE
jgi:hypothetical protein